MNDLINLQAPVNRAGLPELRYRIGDYASFRSRLIQGLIRLLKPASDAPSISLQKLTTRAPDDPAIALLDACATVADVLTFYQERIINEGYILTATERRSVVELARMIGYELDPGVAASTDLAFTVDDAPDSPKIVTIPKGTQILSVPVKDELPQTFETIAEFVAHVEWNSLKPRPTRTQIITSTTRSLYLEGITTQLQPSDPVLLMDGEKEDFHLLIVDTVQPNAALNHTLITWKQQFSSPNAKPPLNPMLLAFRQQVHLFGHNAPRWEDMPTEIKLVNGGKPKGGVYRFENDSWQPVSNGLTSLEVRCVAVNAQKGLLFAGTAGGMFRSKDDGNTWIAINSGLTNLNVQAILIESNQILIGTPASDVFRSTDDGESWSSIGIGRIETVRSGLTTTTAAKPTPNTVVRSLTIQNQFIFAATDDGIYRTDDLGKNWHPIKDVGVPPPPIQTTVTLGTSRFVLLQGQVYRSTDLGQNWILKALPTNKTAFSLAVDQTQTKLFAIAGDGTYESSDQGDTWNFSTQTRIKLPEQAIRSVAALTSNLFAILNGKVYRSSNQGETWVEMQPNNEAAYSLIADHKQNRFLAGGENGVYQFADSANSWTLIAGSPTKAQSIAVNSDNGTLYTASPAGFFRFQSNQWQKMTTTETMVDQNASIVVYTKDGTERVFTGSQFTGFINDNWIDFQIQTPAAGSQQEIDLDTLYPRILIDSWIVLKHHDQFQPCKIKDLTTIQRSGFTLNTQITRILTETAIAQTQNFDLRATVVLAQSEALEIAQIPLTVPVQKAQIFFDPIWKNKIFLNQYVVGLQLQQKVIVSGKYIRAEIKNIGGVAKLGGETWSRLNHGLTNTQATAIALTTEAFFLGTHGGGVFRSTDQGETWKPFNQGLENLQIQTLVIHQSFLFAGTAGSGIFRNNGEKWEAVNTNLSYLDIQAFLLMPSGDLLAGTLEGGVFRSANNGESWLPTGLDNTDVQALLAISDNEILAGTTRDGVFHSTDGGATWAPLNMGLAELNITNVTALIAAPGTESIALAGTAGSGIFRLMKLEPIDDEDNPRLEWSAIASNPIDLTIRSFASADQKFFVGTAMGGVFQSIDRGERWTPINAGLTSTDPSAKVNMDIRALAVFQDQLFAAGTGILISHDHLYTVPLQVSDRLQVLQPPEPLLQEQSSATPQKWLLSDRNGFVGNLITVSPDDIQLEPALATDSRISESHSILIPPINQQEPILFLTESIQHSFDPITVEIYANVVPATHGETISEVLGSGDGTITHQRFDLQKPPVTYVAAPTSRGSQTTLQIRVNELLWQDVRSLCQHQPQEEIYITRIADDGITTITFGDGKSGSRLPTGIENVVATYRSGIGLEGQVEAGQLSLLKTRPLGISQVINPLPATGAANPETMAEAKISAPLTTRTLDRIVSFQDYEDFARSFVGIGKAKAIALWTGGIQQIQITIAAIAGNAVEPGTALYTNLVNGIEAVRDPGQPMQIDSYELLRFNLDAKLLIEPRYLAEKVIAQVQAALMTRFQFEQRDFAQPVTASEVIATIQSIEGVIAVDLDALYRLDRARSLEQSLIALPARWDAQLQEILPAQLLLIHPAGIRLSVEATL